MKIINLSQKLPTKEKITFGDLEIKDLFLWEGDIDEEAIKMKITNGYIILMDGVFRSPLNMTNLKIKLLKGDLIYKSMN